MALMRANSGIFVCFMSSSVLGSDRHRSRCRTDPVLLPRLRLQVLLPQEEVQGLQEGSQGRRRSEECPDAWTRLQGKGPSR